MLGQEDFAALHHGLEGPEVERLRTVKCFVNEQDVFVGLGNIALLDKMLRVVEEGCHLICRG